jgi:hypothetical protein
VSYRTLRAIHGALAFALAALLLVYAATGFMMIHRLGDGTPRVRQLRVTAPRLGGAQEELPRVHAAARAAAAAAGLSEARVKTARFVDGAWQVSLNRTARSAEVRMPVGEAWADVAMRDAAFREGFRRLHRITARRAFGGELAWVVATDLLALALVVFSVTGVWMFARLKRDRRLGWALLGASTLYTLGGIAWLALSR